MCVTIKKLQRNGLCAVPVLLDYTADKTTATVSFPHTLKDLAWVVSKLLEQPDMLSPSQEAHTSPAKPGHGRKEHPTPPGTEAYEAPDPISVLQTRSPQRFYF